MTLKQQIEATIAAYEEACKPENLNIDYCFKNSLQSGLCLFLESKNFKELKVEIEERLPFKYLCDLPIQLYNQDIILAHQTRLQYLQHLLTSLPNDRTN